MGLYDLTTRQRILSLEHPAVVLDCSFAVDDNSVITASLDRHVRLYFASPTLSFEQIINQGRENRYDLNAPQFERVITTHREAVRCICYNYQHGCFFSSD